ncbi:MAG: glycine cleavage system protein GcvH [Candidatus Desulforudis sp.]|nr:glycine cleavage system protein GcvH [Desulforudis sp.]
MQVPDDLKYSKEHEWVRTKADGAVTVGITDYAQDAMGDIVFVELPRIGDSFAAGEPFCTLESVKAVSECYMPAGGKITAVNESLLDSPELVNQDPYGAGWLVEVELDDAAEPAALMIAAEYAQYLASLTE